MQTKFQNTNFTVRKESKSHKQNKTNLHVAQTIYYAIIILHSD